MKTLHATLLVSLLVGASCSRDPAPASAPVVPPVVKDPKPAAPRAWPEVEARALHEELAGPVVLLDVRTLEEHRAGHIEGARNISIRAPEFDAEVAQLPRDGRYVVHCAANVPAGRSDRAMEKMRELGFRDVRGLHGGIGAWQAAGLPTTSSEPPAH